MPSKFWLNGEVVSIKNLPGNTHLIDYLHSPSVRLCGTKIGCREGGCGSCTVLQTRIHPHSGQTETVPVLACLLSIGSLSGTAITTIEGVRDLEKIADGPTELQKELCNNDATQCGYCTPGFIMSMYGLRLGDPDAIDETVENYFGGNFCRCTGYADLLKTARWSKNLVVSVDGAASLVKNHLDELMDHYSDWLRPTTLEAINDIILKARQQKKEYRLITGNTGHGVYKALDDFTEIFIDLSKLDILTKVSQSEQFLVVGAGLTINHLIETIRSLGNDFPQFEMLISHLQQIGGEQIRNQATIGGSIGLMKYVQRVQKPEKPVPAYGADWATLATVLKTEIMLWKYNETEIVPVESFLEDHTDQEQPLILAFRIPKTPKIEFAKSFRVALRAQNASAFVQMAFCVQLNKERTHVIEASIVVGALTYSPIRLAHSEQKIKQVTITLASLNDLLTASLEDMKKVEITTYRAIVSQAYKRELISKLITKFWLQLCHYVGIELDRQESGIEIIQRDVSHHKVGKIQVEYFDERLTPLDSIVLDFNLSTVIRNSNVLWPFQTIDEARVQPKYINTKEKKTEANSEIVKQPKKVSGLLQAQGKSMYTYDITGPVGTLFACYIYGRVGSGTFSYPGGIEAFRKKISIEEGVVGYIAYDSIPEKARNLPYKDGHYFIKDSVTGGQTNLNKRGNYDPVFAQFDIEKEIGYLSCYGQPIGLVVANDFSIAKRIARKFGALVEFTIGDGHLVEPPIYDIQDILAQPIEERNVRVLMGKGEYTAFNRTKGGKFDGEIEKQLKFDNEKTEYTSTEGVFEVRGRQTTGAQAHFYMEPQVALVELGEDDEFIVHTSSQYLTRVQDGVSAVLGLPSNKIIVRTTRLGGAFGGKELRPRFYAAAAAVAAYVLKQPVKLALDRETDILMTGTRHPFTGFYMLQGQKNLENGKERLVINKQRIEYYSNAGISFDCSLPVMDLVLLDSDGPYKTPNLKAVGQTLRTNFPSRTAFRSFGLIQGSLIREEAIEHLAHAMKIDSDRLRRDNFYADATATSFDTTPYGQPLIDCRINEVWDKLWERAEVEDRKLEIEEFNKKNRWKKRGLAMIPIKYGISYTHRPSNFASAHVFVYGSDGSITVHHGGIEMGQGLDTKLLMLAAEEIGLSFPGRVNIKIGSSDTNVIPNPRSSGASTTADLNGGAVLDACRRLRERLETFLLVDSNDFETSEMTYFRPNTEKGMAWAFLRRNITKKLKLNDRINQQDIFNKKEIDFLIKWRQYWETAWPELIQLAYNCRINLSAEGFFTSENFGVIKNGYLEDLRTRIFYYYTYSAAVSEVEIDVLTGEFNIRRSDLLYDAGKSLNENIDFGQIKGGFIQGIGNLTTECMVYDELGGPLTNSSWSYKIPCTRTIPEIFNVYLLEYIPTENQQKAPLDQYGIQSSKSTGEPPLVLATSVFFALKKAILAARQEIQLTEWFDMPAPATVPTIFMYSNGQESNLDQGR